MGPLKTVIGIALVCVSLANSPSAGAASRPGKTVHVDCAAAAGGDGSKAKPFGSITSAVSSVRPTATTQQVTIDVADGVCDQEPIPIQLDFPVHVRGNSNNTVVTWVPPSPVPASAAALVFFRITGDDVRVSKLTIDGRIAPDGTKPGPNAPAPIGVLAERATGFEADHLRLLRVGVGVRANAASGLVRDNYVSTVGGGIVVTGGDPASPPMMTVRNNRIEDYWIGALAVAGAGPVGQSIRVVFEGNDAVTSYTDTGPSNPFGVRINPKQYGGPFLEGTVDAVVRSNRFRGSPRFGIIVDGGQLVRRADGAHYSGTVKVTFVDNEIDRAAVTYAASLITFTNSRATQLPCELDPAQTVAECPTLQGSPVQYWEYLQTSRYELRHSGELDGALIDHPETDPIDGRALGNVLVVDGQVVPAG